MIRFWVENIGFLKTTAVVLAAALLFTIVAPPFAQATIWEERRRAVESMNEKRQKTEKALRQERSLVSSYAKTGGGARDNAFESAALGTAIPEEFGGVAESWAGSGGWNERSPESPLVIHIQDAHGYYDAQKNAAEILRLLSESKGQTPADDPGGAVSSKPLLVCVEGAWDRGKLDWASAFPDKTGRK